MSQNLNNDFLKEIQQQQKVTEERIQRIVGLTRNDFRSLDTKNQKEVNI